MASGKCLHPFLVRVQFRGEARLRSELKSQHTLALGWIMEGPGRTWQEQAWSGHGQRSVAGEGEANGPRLRPMRSLVQG